MADYKNVFLCQMEDGRNVYSERSYQNNFSKEDDFYLIFQNGKVAVDQRAKDAIGKIDADNKRIVDCQGLDETEYISTIFQTATEVGGKDTLFVLVNAEDLKEDLQPLFEQAGFRFESRRRPYTGVGARSKRAKRQAPVDVPVMDMGDDVIPTFQSAPEAVKSAEEVESTAATAEDSKAVEAPVINETEPAKGSDAVGADLSVVGAPPVDVKPYDPISDMTEQFMDMPDDKPDDFEPDVPVEAQSAPPKKVRDDVDSASPKRQTHTPNGSPIGIDALAQEEKREQQETRRDDNPPGRNDFAGRQGNQSGQSNSFKRPLGNQANRGKRPSGVSGQQAPQQTALVNTGGISLVDLEREVFVSDGKETSPNTKRSELDNQKALTISLYYERLKSSINLFYQVDKKYKFEDAQYLLLISTLVKSKNFKDFQESWTSVLPGANLDGDEKKYNQLLEEVDYYVRLCNMFYNEDKW